MWRSLLVLISLVATSPCIVEGQTEHLVESGGVHVIVTSWSPTDDAWASMLLVPGWGGGPSDVLGMAAALSDTGVEVFVLTPRGWHESRGEASFSNALADIGAALGWARTRAAHEVVLGGHSFGGGMAMAYAAQDTTVQRVVSVAGTDHGQLVRQYQSDPAFAAILEPILEGTAAPEGPIRFDVSSTLEELEQGQERFGLRENAASLASRDILMFGGWEDRNTTVDDYMLPLYRALRAAGAENVRFRVYHTDHGFRHVRESLYRDLRDWLRR